MKENLQNHILIGATLLLTALALVFGTWFVHFNQREIETKLRAQLSTQEDTLRSLADITDRNGADTVIEATVSDCSKRQEFEALLERIDSLSTRDMLTLQGLFDSCGSFYAERKALMVSKLERELLFYTDLESLLASLSTNDLDSFKVTEWGELIALERTRSTLLTEQKNLQEKIIAALISGERAGGAQVSGFVRDAGEINELLSVHDRMIDEKREALFK